MKVTQHQQEVYQHPDFEAYFDKLHKEEIVSAAISGQQDGKLNKPHSHQHYQIQYLSAVKSVIQKAIDYNFSLFKPVSSVAAVKELRTAGEKNTGDLRKKSNNIEKHILFLKHDLSNFKIGSLSAWMKILIPSLFGASEGILLYNVLQNAGYSFLVKTLLSFIIALSSGFGLHLGAAHINKTSDIPTKKRRFAMVTAIAFIIALALGVWRAVISNASTDINARVGFEKPVEHSLNFYSLPFVVISFVSFLIGLLFELKYGLSDDERARILKYQAKRQELRTAEAEKESLDKEIKAIDTNVNEASAFALMQQEYAYTNERRLLSLGEQLKTKYEATNIEYRSDNTCPSFFGQPFPEMYTLYFTELFNHLKS